MKIIRDPETAGIHTAALLIDWGMNHCYVKDCKASPTTLITGVEGAQPFALCEEHFQQGNVPGGTTLNLVWPERSPDAK